MRIVFDRATLVLAVSGRVIAPDTALPNDTLVVAIAEDALELSLSVADRAGVELPLSLTRQDGGVAELRRWRAAIPAAAARPLRVMFSLRIERRSALLLGFTPDVVFASGASFAWYPQIVDPNDVRLGGAGDLTYLIDDLTIVSSGALAPGAGAGALFRSSAPDYFDFAAAQYVVYEGPGSRVRIYALRERPGMQAFAASMEHVVRALEAEFGDLPKPRLDIVEAPTETARAAGFDGVSLDGFLMTIEAYLDQPLNTAFFAHEASHQWWGAMVRRRGPAGAYLLDEALAQYGSLRAVEAIEGEAAAQTHRRTGYPGYYTEYGAFWYLARSLEGVDAPLLDLPANDGFVARRVADAKGMLVWDMLSRFMGRRRFAAFLTQFARDHAFRRVTLDEFMTALRAALGDGAWFIDQWFARTGAPDFVLAWGREGRRVTLSVRQSGSPYRASVPIVIHGADNFSRKLVLDVDGPETTLLVDMAFRPESVVLDPDYTILRWTPEFRQRARDLAPYTRADVVLNQGESHRAAQLFQSALESAANGTPELRFLLLRGLGDAAFGAERPQDAVTHYREALEAAPVDHEVIPEVWRSLGDALRALGDLPGAAQAAAEQAASYDRLVRAFHPQ